MEGQCHRYAAAALTFCSILQRHPFCIFLVSFHAREQVPSFCNILRDGTTHEVHCITSCVSCMQYFLLSLVGQPQNVTSILFVQRKLVPFPACLPLALLREERLLLLLCGGIKMGLSSRARLCQVTAQVKELLQQCLYSTSVWRCRQVLFAPGDGCDAGGWAGAVTKRGVHGGGNTGGPAGVGARLDGSHRGSRPGPAVPRAGRRLPQPPGK
jgi:hypothetical protein